MTAVSLANSEQPADRLLSLSPARLYSLAAWGAWILRLRQDVLDSTRVPLAMEALHRLAEPGGARRHKPQPVHKTVRHGEYGCHEDDEVQGPFIMPRRKEGCHI